MEVGSSDARACRARMSTCQGRISRHPGDAFRSAGELPGGGLSACSKCESVTPTSRMPFAGKHGAHKAEADLAQGFLEVTIAGRVRLRVAWRKSSYLIFTVTVRPKACAFSHQAQTSSAIACTPASISAGCVRSLEKVVSDPEDCVGGPARPDGGPRHWRWRETKRPDCRVFAGKPTTVAADLHR